MLFQSLLVVSYFINFHYHFWYITRILYEARFSKIQFDSYRRRWRRNTPWVRCIPNPSCTSTLGYIACGRWWGRWCLWCCRTTDRGNFLPRTSRVVGLRQTTWSLSNKKGVIRMIRYLIFSLNQIKFTLILLRLIPHTFSSLDVTDISMRRSKIRVNLIWFREKIK